METGSSQSGPSISSDHQEGFSLAWTQVDKGRATLLAQYFDAMAKPVWNREGMNLAHSRVVAQLETLRWSQERILIAVWREHGGAGDVWKAQALDAAGQRLWSLDGFEMVAENAGDENPAVVVNENGHIFIAWEEPKPDSRRILVQKWNPKGLQEWNLSGVPVAMGEQGEQRDCTLSEGKEDVYAVWRCSVGDHPWTLYAQHLGADGTRLWGKGRILSEQPLPGQRPLAIRDDYGGLIAAWLEQGAPHEWQMKTMRLDSEGHPVWAVK